MNSQHTHQPDSTSSVVLTGAILFANLDGSTLAEYAVKAAIGGAIWLVFKVASDYIGKKIKSRK